MLILSLCESQSWRRSLAELGAFSLTVLRAISNYILTHLNNPNSTKWWPLRSVTLSAFLHLQKHTPGDSRFPSRMHSATCLSGVRRVPQPNQSVICDGKDRVTPNGCHSEELHLDVLPSLKGHVCISGTNRQHIWHCHRNMALRMDAANEGRPVLTQPELSIAGVIIYCLHPLCHTHTPEHKQGEPPMSTSSHFSPSITHTTHTLLSLGHSEGRRRGALFHGADYSENLLICRLRALTSLCYLLRAELERSVKHDDCAAACEWRRRASSCF